MTRADFDNAASLYDSTFTHTGVGRAQRNLVWKTINRLPLPKNGQVVEINCGTGEDAHLWKEKGYSITATDISSEMIDRARSKYPDIDFRVSDMCKLHEINLHFDILFSDFGGLNCLSESALKQLFGDSVNYCNPGGRLVFVIMGKKCRWDYWYQIWKGRFRDRNRRNTDKAVMVPVDGIAVPTYYYSPKQIRLWAAEHYQVETLRPIGYFVPPSYLSPFFDKHPHLLRLLEKIDTLISFSWLANRSDHYLISLRKA